ncbi:rhomboid family intramembrane serine protease [Candidatus Nanohalococcus occultus]|uniref:rhomboid family intramembrane serine protease n=1 Tax=Candidatus Nanohalococcus occultus TaxID=2978047 RepID=UPI0039DFDBA1
MEKKNDYSAARKQTEGRFRWMAAQFCVLLGLVFAFQVFSGFDPGFNASSSPWWKFFTSFFGHSGPEHLLNNVFFLALFGSIYERLTSGKTFLLTFLVSAIFANLTAFIFFPETSIIGASGGAFGILTALAVYEPRRIGLALGVPMPMWATLAVYTLIQFAGLTATGGSTAFEAHIFGMLAGAPIGYMLRSSGKEELEQKELEEDSWQERISKWEEKWML